MEKYEIELPKVWLHLEEIKVKSKYAFEGNEIKIQIEMVSDDFEGASKFASAFMDLIDETALREEGL